jgi:hypothetical protein
MLVAAACAAKHEAMRKIHTAPSLVEVAHLRNVLAAEGIGCWIMNDRLGGALGEIPFVECWPELWLERPGDALRAQGLIELALRAAPEGDPWTCRGCGESVERQFAACWNCGADDAGTATP